ncbi:MAG: hypothetical protein M0T77_02640 [Actinomycetota bacterium]|nr:hypothetical protein [Actinomycetota bacterium]
MTRDGIAELPLCHEQCACTAPTATRIFDTFVGVQRHHLTHDGQHIQVFDPELTALQHQLLELLAIPANTGTPSR